jgi:hypothetical protein
MQLQKLDPIFNMGVNVIRPAFNLEPKYRDTMLTTEEWTMGPRTPPAVKGLVWYTDGSRLWRGTVARVYGPSLGRRHSICLEKYATVSRPRYMPSWPVHIKFIWMLDQRNSLVFSVIVGQL